MCMCHGGGGGSGTAAVVLSLGGGGDGSCGGTVGTMVMMMMVAMVFYPQQSQVVYNRLMRQRLHKYVIQIVECRGTQAHISPGHVHNVRTVEPPP